MALVRGWDMQLTHPQSHPRIRASPPPPKGLVPVGRASDIGHRMSHLACHRLDVTGQASHVRGGGWAWIVLRVGVRVWLYGMGGRWERIHSEKLHEM